MQALMSERVALQATEAQCGARTESEAGASMEGVHASLLVLVCISSLLVQRRARVHQSARARAL
jgi:hypothetical protein